MTYRQHYATAAEAVKIMLNCAHEAENAATDSEAEDVLSSCRRHMSQANEALSALKQVQGNVKDPGGARAASALDTRSLIRKRNIAIQRATQAWARRN